ncbi:MAG: BACON domain-containing carbohydrate-binding protein, partial [Bacteroidales bacterium]
AQENNSSDKRTATISVVATRGGADEIVSLNVVQPGTGSAELRIAVMDYTFGPKAVKAFEIPVTALHGTTYSVASKPEFVTISGDGTSMLGIDVASNENTTEPRSGVIILKAANGSDETQYDINITQLGMNGPNVTAAVSSIVVPRTAIEGTEGYDVALIGVDAATSLRTSSSATWIQGVITATDYLSFKTEENTSSEKRTAVVSVIATRAGEEQVIPVQVTQPGTGDAELRLALPSYTFTYLEVKKFAVPVTMANGTKYTVAAKPEWLTIEGEGTATMLFSIPKNEVTAQRAGTVVLRATNGDDETEYTIGVIQLGMDGPNVAIAFDTIVLPQKGIDKAYGYYIPVTGIDDETQVLFVHSYGWAVPSFSEDHDRLLFTTSTNDLSVSRECDQSIVATKAGQKQIINYHVIQLGTGDPQLVFNQVEYYIPWDQTSLVIPFVRLNDPDIEFGFEGSDTDFVVGSGSNKNTLVLHFSKNETTSERSVTLLALAANDAVTAANTYRILIHQGSAEGPIVTPVVDMITIGNPEAGHMLSADILLSGWDTSPETFIQPVVDSRWLSALYSYDGIVRLFAIQANPSSEPRSVQVNIMARRSGEYAVIPVTVTQPGNGGANFVTSQSVYSVTREGTTSTEPLLAYYSCNLLTKATVLASPDWIRVDGTEFGFNANDATRYIPIVVDENNTPEERTGYILFSLTNGTEQSFYKVGIVQPGLEGPNASLLWDKVEMPQAGVNDVKPYWFLDDFFEYEIDLLGMDAQTTISASSNVEWLTIADDQGEGQAHRYVLNASPNNHVDARHGQIGITVEKNGQFQYFVVNVTQLGTGSPRIALGVST